MGGVLLEKLEKSHAEWLRTTLEFARLPDMGYVRDFDG